MIEDGKLVPGQFELRLQSWQLESTALNAILVAILATILSYQLSATAYDLLLGFKTRYEANASDIHAALLTDEGSLKSIWAAVLRKDWLDRARFGRNIPPDTVIAREPCPVKRRVVAKLFILLIAAPLLNGLAVVITLERDQDLTFASAEFGGMSVGVNDDLSFLTPQEFTKFCAIFPFEVADHQQAKASFFWCTVIPGDEDSNGSWMSVETESGEVIHTSIVISGIRSHRLQYFTLETDETTFRIRQTMSEVMLRTLLEYGNRRLAKFCLRNDSTTSDVVRGGNAESGINLSKNVSCTSIGRDAVDLVLLEMSRLVTLREAKLFEVVKESESFGNKIEYMRADDLPLLKHRSSYVGLGTLFVVAGSALLLRIIVSLLTRNDIHDGITILVRTCMGVQPEDSLLRWKGIVRYDYKHQRGETAHFGVRREKLPEVSEFKGGMVGLVDERPKIFVEECVSTLNVKQEKNGPQC